MPDSVLVDQESQTEERGSECACWPEGRLSMEGMVKKSVCMLEHLTPEKATDINDTLGDSGVPCALLRNAKGIGFITAVKTGFFCGAHGGMGVIVARKADGSWSQPAAFNVVGLAFGFVFGASIVDVLLIFNSESQIAALGSRNLIQLGADVQLTVGPVGRDARAVISAGEAGVAGCYAYSFAKGLFVGMSVDAGLMRPNNGENTRFYGVNVTPAAIFSGDVEPVQPSAVVQRLHDLLGTMAV